MPQTKPMKKMTTNFILKRSILMNNLYVDLHVIQSMPPNCLNRDDTGSPKTAIYGGARRARVSSQAWKHAMRAMFREHFDPLALGQRTKDIIGLVIECMPEGFQIGEDNLKEKVRETINLASSKASNPIIPEVSYKDIKKDLSDAEKEWDEDKDVEPKEKLISEMRDCLKKVDIEFGDVMKLSPIFKLINDAIKAEKDDAQRKIVERNIRNALLSSAFITKLVNKALDALFFMGRQEAVNIARLVVESIKGEKPSKKQVQEALNYYPGKKGAASFAVDVALFGRMVAKAPELNVDASSQVAHAISTHAVDIDFDFYTAVDDRTCDENLGAGMMGTVEFNSSTLYRYATVAVHELFEQLTSNVEATAKVVREFVRAFAMSMPSGKMNAFANKTPPDMLYVTIRSDTPVNLVGAFESPITHGNGYTKASIEQFSNYAQGVYGSFVTSPEKSYVTMAAGGAEILGVVCELETILKNVESDIVKTL
jgi:CRISPR system Cascade subunit CasC